MQKNHLQWLDWMRFLAALLVVIVHVRGASVVAFGALPDQQKTVVAALFFAVTRIGHEAVICFFVLSGFLVGGKVFERMHRGDFRIGDYVVDRVSRLYLPLILTAAVGIATGETMSAGQFVGNLFSLQGIVVSPPALNGPLWSLSYEFWFYALAGAIAVAVTRKSQIAFVLLVLVLTLFAILQPHYLICWMIGAVAYVCRPRQRSPFLIVLGICLTLGGTGLSQLLSASDSLTVPALGFMNAEMATIVLAAGIAIFIQQIILVVPRREGTRRLEAAGTRLAEFSYTLYLTHYPIVMGLSALGFGQAPELGAGTLMTMGAKIMLCLLVAWILYLLFERHTHRVRRWLKGLGNPAPNMPSEAGS